MRFLGGMGRIWEGNVRLTLKMLLESKKKKEIIIENWQLKLDLYRTIKKFDGDICLLNIN